jgi:MFS family permease
MLTMPLAGALTDKFGPGKFVMTGMVLIVAGLVPMTMLGTDTSYWVTTGAFFVMGLGMGMTMMPTMTAALKTLKDHQIARGSTMTNITQQVAASIGTAVISVLLTNFLKKDPTAGLAILSNADPVNGPGILAGAAQQLQVPADALKAHGLTVAADAFGQTSLIALILVALTLIPAFFLPRKRQESEVDPATTAAMMH